MQLAGIRYEEATVFHYVTAYAHRLSLYKCTSTPMQRLVDVVCDFACNCIQLDKCVPAVVEL